MKKLLFTIYFMLYWFAKNSIAIENVEDKIIVKDCIVTPQLWSLDSPRTFANTSELRKSAGSTVMVEGKSIIVIGTVFDQNCVPLTGANVKIWQKNFGKKKLPTDQTMYTGSNISDNLGNFSFYTIMPISENGESPKIYIHISHPDIMNFETVLLFPNNKNNDEELKGLSNEEKNLLIAKCKNCLNNHEVPIYELKIVVEGKANYKSY